MRSYGWIGIILLLSGCVNPFGNQDEALVPAGHTPGITSAGGMAASCTDDALNASACTTVANRYVTGTAGANVTGADGSISFTIPRGYYSGTQTATASDSDLAAANIKNGVTILGVAGSFAGASAAVLVENSSTTNGTGTATCTVGACPAGYTSLGCASGAGGNGTNSAGFINTVKGATFDNALSTNFGGVCTRTYSSANIWNRATCIRLCVQ